MSGILVSVVFSSWLIRVFRNKMIQKGSYLEHYFECLTCWVHELSSALMEQSLRWSDMETQHQRSSENRANTFHFQGIL